MNEQLTENNIREKRISVLKTYGECLSDKTYITNPAIGRDEQIKQMILILLTPDKSCVLIGKPGVGKTATVEGLAYRIQNNDIPDVLKGYKVIKLSILLEELKNESNLILFIDEIHTLMGEKGQALDFANAFKPALDRGDIKVVGATTNDEYERYILRDKAFVRRFQKVEIFEPTREENIAILMGTLPKIEKRTGAKMMYTSFIKSRIMEFITDITSEYKRIYEIGSRYPDVSLTIVQQAFSNALFNNRRDVNILDIRTAIISCKHVYPDVIKKSIPVFDEMFAEQIMEMQMAMNPSFERLGE